jgi:hypothetical protein
MRLEMICRSAIRARLASLIVFGFSGALLLSLVSGIANASILLDLDAQSLGQVETHDIRPPLGIFAYDTYGINGHDYGTNNGSVHIDLETIGADAAGGWAISDQELYAETYVRSETGPEGWTSATARMDIFFTLAQPIGVVLDFERTNPDVTMNGFLRLENAGDNTVWASTVTDIGVPLTLEPGRYRFSMFAETISHETQSDLTTARFTIRDSAVPELTSIAIWSLLGIVGTTLGSRWPRL